MPSSQELIAQLMGTVYACAHLNSESVASAKLRLFVKTGKGQPITRWRTAKISRLTKKSLQRKAELKLNEEDQLDEITDHPLLTLLDPNQSPDEDDAGQPTLTGYDLFYCTQMYLESIGVAYWWLEKDGAGIPVAIHLLRSQFVREVPDKDNPGRLAGYAYGGETEPRFKPEDVIKFHIPDTANPLLGGFSASISVIEDVRIDREMKANIQAVLKNAARPDAIWSPKGDSEGGGIGEAEARRVRGAMKEEFTRAGRGGILVSESPGNLQILGWKPGDVVELERAKMIKLAIMNGFGVPNAMLDLNEANLASASAAEYQYSKRTVMPRCNRIARTLRKLINAFDNSGRLILTYDDPTPDDKAFALSQARTGMDTGALSVNEGREAMGQGPLDDDAGDIRYVPSAMVAVLPNGTLAPPTQQPGSVMAGDAPAPKPAQADDAADAPQPGAPPKPSKPFKPGKQPKPKKSLNEQAEASLRKMVRKAVDELLCTKPGLNGRLAKVLSEQL